MQSSTTNILRRLIPPAYNMYSMYVPCGLWLWGAQRSIQTLPEWWLGSTQEKVTTTLTASIVHSNMAGMHYVSEARIEPLFVENGQNWHTRIFEILQRVVYIHCISITRLRTKYEIVWGIITSWPWLLFDPQRFMWVRPGIQVKLTKVSFSGTTLERYFWFYVWNTENM